MDIKYLTDIPPYWEQMQRLGLPRFQYTVRDVKSGMLFLGYGDEVSIEKAVKMLDHVLGKIAPNFVGKIKGLLTGLLRTGINFKDCL